MVAPLVMAPPTGMPSVPGCAMSIKSIRRDLDNAAGEAFLPEGWQRLAGVIPLLLAVATEATKVLDTLVNWDHNEECECWAEAVDAHPGLINPECDCGLSDLARHLSDPLAALEAQP